MRIRNHYLDVEMFSVSSVFIARGYVRSNAQNRHFIICYGKALLLLHAVSKFDSPFRCMGHRS